MEEIVLLETLKAAPKHTRVFKLQFPAGEFDMTVANEKNISCRIYEIKHSKEAFPAQYRFLADKEKCAQAEHRYGEIKEKAVIYRGESKRFEGMEYVNVEEYLEGLG